MERFLFTPQISSWWILPECSLPSNQVPWASGFKPTLIKSEAKLWQEVDFTFTHSNPLFTKTEVVEPSQITYSRLFGSNSRSIPQTWMNFSRNHPTDLTWKLQWKEQSIFMFSVLIFLWQDLSHCTVKFDLPKKYAPMWRLLQLHAITGWKSLLQHRWKLFRELLPVIISNLILETVQNLHRR